MEYLHCKNGTTEPWIVQNNVFSGDETCGYKIIVGKGDDVSRPYMMNPNNLFMEVKTESVQKQTILGLFLPETNRESFVLLNFGAGQARVSGRGGLGIKALYEQYRNPLSLKMVIEALGGEISDTPDGVDYDLSLVELDKDAFIGMF